jgi:hypothetical protein
MPLLPLPPPHLQPRACACVHLQLLPTQGYPVVPGTTYVIRVGVADVGDADVDTAVLLKAGSLVLTAPPAVDAGGPYSAVG